MDKIIAQAIMQFMLRVNLSGHEVPAFNASMDALQAELDRPAESLHEVNNGTEE